MSFILVGHRYFEVEVWWMNKHRKLLKVNSVNLIEKLGMDGNNVDIGTSETIGDKLLLENLLKARGGDVR